MENPLIIFGAGNVGISALEIFQQNNVIVYGFLDDDEKLHGQEIGNVQILGSTEDEKITNLVGEKCDVFVAIENTKLKSNLIDLLLTSHKTMPVNALSSKSYISPFSAIGHGNLLSSGATLHALSKVGSYTVLGANVVIDTSATVGDYVQIGANSVVSAGVTIADGVFVGAGVTIIAGIKIEKNARIGAGSVVMADVKANQTVFGVPAMEVKK